MVQAAARLSESSAALEGPGAISLSLPDAAEPFRLATRQDIRAVREWLVSKL
jgi:hypothetical protein